MNKKLAFFLSLSITILLAGDYYFFTAKETRNFEQVVVGRVIDGDTLELEDGRVVRLLNINTPEKKEFGYFEALAFLQEYENSTIELEVTGTEKYGRLLGRVYAPDYLNLEIVRRGLGHTLLVTDADLEAFDKAQKEAIEAGEGIWENSPDYGCLTGEINKKEEYVRLERRCDVNINGWTIKDETTRKYTLGDTDASSFYLYSDKGTNTREARYWGRGSVWNNDRDSIFIRDAQDGLVFYDSYGY